MNINTEIFLKGKNYAKKTNKQESLNDFLIAVISNTDGKKIFIYPEWEDDVFEFLKYLSDNESELYGHLIDWLEGDDYEQQKWNNFVYSENRMF